MFLCVFEKTHYNYMVPLLKFHWPQELSIFQWLVSKLLRREWREHGVGLLSLCSLFGCCRLQSSQLIKLGISEWLTSQYCCSISCCFVAIFLRLNVLHELTDEVHQTLFSSYYQIGPLDIWQYEEKSVWCTSSVSCQNFRLTAHELQRYQLGG